ncbi:helix-turn-helix domain-containing protein [Catenulispora sp. NF23]|uniref:Helix-turn-helix domain-containing protein n=1 Tax=Catenulispora pinistramenti TaxID=2705254 RepID=A0ABS5KTA5_9ACTN|nr:helix-turn-helix transcriptional regulator [Catenulispora pinistramenti]MBS2537713.1 helix-turn-helix domain-containing protein [Catenulispora pinistramenti]MBS2549244.1 helix-turn-helix domain-containing protein [Catenulispora pinistramenti]
MHEARDALGKRLRELRQQASMSGRQLAESLSWPSSKVSKLENGRQTPTDNDIRSWTRATTSDGETEALLASLHTLEIQHAEWQRQLKTGLKPHQQAIAELDARTRLFRAFESTFIPGLLQTAEYARFRFAQSITVFKVRNDINEAVAARVQRQEILYRPDKRFHLVLTEAALRYRLCPPEVMIGQLDRLTSLTSLPNMKLGIIGFESTYVVAPAHGFWILDNDRVMVETFSAELNLAQPQEISLYSGIFESLAGAASYGRAARAIINRVIEDLVPEDAEGSE